MNKKIIMTLIAAVAVFSLAGCGITSTVTKTESYTDADGNTTTTTTTTTTDKSGTTTDTEVTTTAEDEEFIVATVAFANAAGFDIEELYFAPGSNDEWGPEILGEDAPLADGEVLTCTDALTYSTVNGLYWDLLAVDAEGGTVEFESLDMSAADNPEDITITLEYDEEAESYTATVD